MAVLIPHWHTKNETMRRVRQRIGTVMKWAVAQRYRDDNPAGDAISAALPKTGTMRKHQRALPFAEVGAALDKVKTSGAFESTVLALKFLVLTACRSSEVRLATWDEVDLESGTRTVPASRMKAKRDHRVPLSARALEILNQAQELSGGTGLVFPSAHGRALSDNTISKLLRDLGIEAVPHGFRSSFRDWAAECSEAAREVCDLALQVYWEKILRRAEAEWSGRRGWGRARNRRRLVGCSAARRCDTPDEVCEFALRHVNSGRDEAGSRPTRALGREQG